MPSDISLEGYDETQIELMNEKCILVDEDDNITGAETKKNCHLNENIKKGLLHRAFSVFLFNSDNELLLQQRAAEKITFPLYWTNTVCSHPLQFEDSEGNVIKDQPEMEAENQLGVKRAAIRKMFQELGITSDQLPIEEFQFLTKILYKAPSDGIWGEHEVDYILIIRRNVSFTPNPNEVKDTKYVSKEQLKTFLDEADANNVPVTPWFRLIVNNFLFKWWDNLDNLSSMQDDTVHKMN